MPISSNIKKLRAAYDLSQKDLASIAGVSNKAVSTWENGIKEPRMGAIQKIADHFGLKKSNLIEDDGMERISQFSSSTSPSPDDLSPREEREIARDLEDMMHSMASAAYEGDQLEDVEAFKATIKAAMIQAKKLAKAKYTPKKYRK